MQSHRGEPAGRNADEPQRACDPAGAGALAGGRRRGHDNIDNRLAARIDQHDASWQLDENQLPRDEPMVATWFCVGSR